MSKIESIHGNVDYEKYMRWYYNKYTRNRWKLGFGFGIRI